jgi:hypothetical protein
VGITGEMTPQWPVVKWIADRAQDSVPVALQLNISASPRPKLTRRDDILTFVRNWTNDYVMKVEEVQSYYYLAGACMSGQG